MKRLLTLGIAAAAFGILVPTPTAFGATYIMMSDATLARRAPSIAHVRAADTATEVGPSGRPFTRTSFSTIEVFKGEVPSHFRLRLPGGLSADGSWFIPGKPEFTPGEGDILFVFPLNDGSGDFGLTEFGLSKFDILEDPDGRLYAGRKLFLGGEAMQSFTPKAGEDDDLRDVESFVSALRVAGDGSRLPPVRHIGIVEAPLRNYGASAKPAPASKSSGRLAPQWVNIGGVEGSSNLFRWFWDTSSSPPGVVEIDGTQSNLSDSSDGTTHVTNAINKWTSVSGSTVDYSGPAGSGNVVISLDVVNGSDGAWIGPFCDAGVIGLGGPGPDNFGPHTFKGDSPYFAIHSGTVEMRQSSCSYDAAVFRSAVLHEMGHTLGLGHPDEDTSIHSTTSSSSWTTAVMHSSIPAAKPDTPQTDDIQAIQFYYGSFGNPAPPVAAFSFSPTSPITSQSVQFTDASSGSPTSWSWNFGDPSSGAANTSTSKNPAHTFASAASYTVTLTASNGAGPSSPVQHTVVVSNPPPPPTANFTFSPTNPVAGQSVQFTDLSTGSPTSWSWNFGDPTSGSLNTSTSRNPSHVFAAAGPYAVTLTSSNAGGPSSPVQKQVSVANPPAPGADFTFAPPSPQAGSLVQFTDSSSNNPTTFTWDFGDGSNSTLRNPSHAYASAGTKTVQHGASNNGGTGSVSKSVTIAPAAGGSPSAAFTFSPPSPTEGSSVQFSDASTGSPSSWTWDFGDPSSGAADASTLQNPTHAFFSCGNFIVMLTAGNMHGSSIAQRTIGVIADPAHSVSAGFSFSPAPALRGQAVQFSDQSTGSPAAWNWNFGDPTSGAANTSTLENPSHVFAQAGPYTVQLTASNDCGHASVSKSAAVNAPVGRGVVVPVASGTIRSTRGPD